VSQEIRQGLLQIQGRVDPGLDVVEDDVSHLKGTGTGQDRVGRDQPARKSGFGDDRLEGRAGRIQALDCPVQQRAAGNPSCEELPEVGSILARPPLVEVRVARQCIERAVAGVDDDRGARVRVGVPGEVGEADAVADRPLGRALEV
jgi:hypothetical protein